MNFNLTKHNLSITEELPATTTQNHVTSSRSELRKNGKARAKRKPRVLFSQAQGEFENSHEFCMTFKINLLHSNRIGAKIQAAAVLVSPRAGSSGPVFVAFSYPSEDLVSK